MENRRLFARPYEALNIGWGLVLVAASVALFALDVGPGKHFSDFELIANFVFFNVVHVGFTFSLLLALPESRSWWREIGAARRRRYAGGSALAFLFAAAGGLLYYRYLPSPLVLVFLAHAGILWWPRVHSVSQVKGFLLLYGRGTGEGFEKIERLCVLLINASTLVGSVLTTAEGLCDFRDPLHLIARGSLAVLVCALVGLSSVALIQARSIGYGKFLYGLRVWMFPFVRGAEWGLVLPAMFHGVEYFCLYRKMTSASGRAASARPRKLAVGAITLFALIPLGRYAFTGWNAAGGAFLTWLFLDRALFMPLVFIHYFLDGVMFRMSDPVTRKHFGPLLRAHGSSETGLGAPAKAA